VDQLSILILLFVFSGLFIALVKGGWSGPGGAETWFKAKFLGQTS
jgi:hypothetical protein